MTSYAFISELNEPWVLITEKSIPKKDIPEGILFLELDAFAMTRLEGLYQQFASVFMFPDYFGKNFNALDELVGWAE